MSMPGHCVIYRFRIKDDAADQFIEGWSAVTCALREQRGALGSRLHRCEDGLWYAYAQWPDAETRAASRGLPHVCPEGSRLMQEATIETLPEIVLTPVKDHLVPGEGA